MAVTYGFYDSVDNDRLYSAKQFSEMMNGVINDGIFESIGDNLVVVRNETLGGLNILVGSGRAWFNGTWTNNDADLPLVLDAASASLNRIDYVILETDSSLSTRANSIKILKGTAASSPVPPTLTNTAELNQYPLASIYISANQTDLTGAEITNLVGSAPCPFVTGILDTVDITAMVAAWETEFDLWLSGLVDQLSEVDAAYLQAQINVITTDLNAAEQDIDDIEANPVLSKEWGVTLFIDAGSEVISTGTKITTEVPFNGSIDSWVITSGDLTSGSVSLILETIPYADFSGGTWVTIGTLSLSSAVKATGIFSGKSMTKGHIMRIRISSAPSLVKKVALSLKGLKT